MVQQEKEAVGSTWEVVAAVERRRQQQRKRRTKMKINHHHRDHENEDAEDEEGEDDGEGNNNGGGGNCERQREHPFIVTEPGEVARGKKNGLDYLFHLYEQCREFLIQVQHIAKERGEKCPTKVYIYIYLSKNILFFKMFVFSLALNFVNDEFCTLMTRLHQPTHALSLSRWLMHATMLV